MSAVQAALAGDPVLAQHYADFRSKAEGALDAGLVALIRQAVAAVHGIDAAPIDDGALDHVLQLAHVAGPAVVQHVLHRLAGGLHAGLAVLAAIDVEEMIDEQGNIALA